MRYLHLFALCLCAILPSVVVQGQNPVDDDPMQLFPPGVKEPTYYYRKATGGTVDKVRIEPPFWWVGMHHPSVEVLIYDQNIKDWEVSVDYPGVAVSKVHQVQNPNYLFVELGIAPGAKAGRFDILLKKSGKIKKYPYELRNRNQSKDWVQGVNAADLMYLIMPDRFANGDTSNDSFEDMNQKGINRNKLFFRHGGDVAGVVQKLDYLHDLGVTAIWLNPVMENDEFYASYHGYAVTDHYNLDKRYCSNEQYLDFVKKCHDKGIKVVMDIIHNHVGDQHFFIKDLPDEDWIHQFPTYTKSIYRDQVWTDPYASEADKKGTADGWFDVHMPDLNQKHPRLANYLTQNTIWWLEYSGQDAYRIDTYYYPDQDFLSEWCRRVKAEFPRVHLFGEAWVHGTASQAFYTQNNHLVEGFNSNLPGVADFQMYSAFGEAIAGKQGWMDGVNKIYSVLSHDFLYEDPMRNVTFLDNHDISRFFSTINGDMNKYKSGIALLYTIRGIPCLYYGTEVLMTGAGGHFGEAGRRDFPGGWAEDKENKFKPEGRTAQEQEAFNFVRTLGRYRKANPVLQNGKTMQYVPENNVYVFFRYDGQKTVMVAFNASDMATNITTSRYYERMKGYTKAVNIISGEVISDLSMLSIDKNSTLILELGH